MLLVHRCFGMHLQIVDDDDDDGFDNDDYRFANIVTCFEKCK